VPRRFPISVSTLSTSGSPRLHAETLLNTGALSFASRSPSFRPRQAATEARATLAASSRLRTSANLGVELIALAISRAVCARTSHTARRTSTSLCGLPQSNIISADGQARDFPHRRCDIKEQETGVELGLKLPQIAPDHNYARGQARAKDNFILRL
jgi:hypothetical protein